MSYGDTDSGQRGRGTMGSRSGTLGGNALQTAAVTVRGTLLEAAAALLEASPADLSLQDGTVTVRGVPDRRASLGEVVASLGSGPLTSQASFSSHGGETFPFSTTIAVVSIDRETARVAIEQFVAVDDCGHVLNPVIVEGQLHGGMAQGIGEVLLEQVSYDSDASLITASLMDYAVPNAATIPQFDLTRTETPSPRNPLGLKGVGESGPCPHHPP